MPRYYSRREIINQGLTLVGFGAVAPYFLTRTAFALSESSKERIFVLIHLAGGNDGLNTVIPYKHDTYYKLRPRLAIEQDKVLRLNAEFGLHPSATGFKQFFDAGELAILHGVGYPNPNRSHFVSTDIWSSAIVEGKPDSGWLGRYQDKQGTAAKHLDPIQGIAFGQQAPLCMCGKDFSPLTFNSPNELQWNPRRANAKTKEIFEKLNSADKGSAANNSSLDFLQQIAADAQVSAEQIRQAAIGKGGREIMNPNFTQQLQMINNMIEAELPTRIYFLSLAGFDTHSAQLVRQQNLLQQLGDGMLQFVQALKESKNLDRVLIMTFSEFGRRVAQNASQGTDHGTAAPMFAIGGNIKPGLHGKHPDLDQLIDNDLQFTTDFRSVYAGVLQDWFHTDPTPILGKFNKLEFLG